MVMTNAEILEGVKLMFLIIGSIVGGFAVMVFQEEVNRR